MNYKRAVGLSVLAYLSSFIVATIVAVAFGINLAETQAIPPLLWYIGAFTAILFAFIFVKLYYRSKKIKPNAKSGLKFGIVMIVTGFALDMVTFLPLFTHEDPLGPILDYYLNPLFWFTLVLILVTTTYTGKHLSTDQQA